MLLVRQYKERISEDEKKEEQEQDVGLGMRAHAQCASCMTVLLWQYRVKLAEYLSRPFEISLDNTLS